MFDYILGLPMHALVIHAVVVLVPLSALVAIAFAVRPPWRRVLRWPVAIGGVVSGVTAFVAAESGEAFQRRVWRCAQSTTDLELLTEHIDVGRPGQDPLPRLHGARRRRGVPRATRGRRPPRRMLEVPLAILLVLSALAALITVVLTGHAGAQVTWNGLG